MLFNKLRALSIAKPTTAASTINAISLSVCIIVCASTIKKPRPWLVAMNSAQITDIHPLLIAILAPVNISGSVAGIIISLNILTLPAPILLAA